jgi:hypothetical protein
MRTDIHAPSQIIPSDYQYVAIWTMNIVGIGDAQFMLQERETVRRHMERTAGTYAHVETSGSCQVCGNVQAIYLALFYHEKSNTYIRVGVNCAQKLDMSLDTDAMNLFRRQLADAREAQAGKRKAIAILSDANLIAAWEIYDAPYPVCSEDCKAAGVDAHGDDNGVTNACTCDRDARWDAYNKWEERTIRDIVGKLVKYGNLSDKQAQFIASLLNKIVERPIVEARRQAEKDAAGPVPTGRVEMNGVVVGMKEVDAFRASRYSPETTWKLIIRLENGSKVYGSRFANLEKGSAVRFTATVEPSKDDLKFGFYKRPKLYLTDEEKKALKETMRVVSN